MLVWNAITNFRIELFVFPDGTAAEIMVFDGAGDDVPIGEYHARRPGAGSMPAPRRDVPERADSLPAPPATLVSGPDARVCQVCGCGLVYPLDWHRNGADTWTLRLRCPNCETQREVLMDRAGVEELNRELYRARQAVAEESRCMTRRNFEEEAGRIVAALSSGLIQPMDF